MSQTTQETRRKNVAKSIDVSDLNIYYGSFLAVEGVTLPIAARSVTAIIGPSGCGKSTFLRSLNRMHEVIPGARVEGKIMIDGRDLYDSGVDPVEVRRNIGMVFQRPNPFPTMTIAENVIAGVRLNGGRIRKAEAAEVVERSLRGANLWEEVKDRLGKPGGSLSGGRQRRLCIARAIAVEPQVLLMDEPCSALDPISTSAIEDLIHELRGRVHDRHRHPQHAAGLPGVGHDRVLQHRRCGQAGQADRVRPDRQDVLQPGQGLHRGLHLRPLRLTSRPSRPSARSVPDHPPFLSRPSASSGRPSACSGLTIRVFRWHRPRVLAGGRSTYLLDRRASPSRARAASRRRCRSGERSRVPRSSAPGHAPAPRWR